MQEDIAIEMAKIMREGIAKVERRMAARQLGEAWTDLERVQRLPQPMRAAA